MHDDLIGYVLGLLDAEEQTSIERLIEINAEIRAHVETLRWGLTVFQWRANTTMRPRGWLCARASDCDRPRKTPRALHRRC